MKKIVLNIIAVVVFSFGVTAQNVNIPDANFKACLLAYSNINTNGDSEIQVSEANAFTGGFNCVNQNISDLTGIEAFTSMIILDCSNNNLNSLDISQNTALKRLFCAGNNLNNLDVTQNSLLEYIVCGDNNLNSLDISQNTNLYNFQCQNNNLSSIDVSPHWNLTIFRCQDNNLLSLDVSNNTQLQDFQCQNNQLTSLNIKNVNWSVFWVNASSNPNLTCIEVDDVTTATAASTNIDVQTSFSTSCSAIVNIPDANFKTYLVGNNSINTNMDSEIQVSEAEAFTGTIDCNNKSISDLTGIEAFVNLTKLICSYNSISNLNVSQNTALTELRLTNNDVSTLDVSQNTALTFLKFQGNNIGSIDISQNIVLVELYCNYNNFSSIDLSQNTVLEKLYCNGNDLTTLDLSQNTALKTLFCGENYNLTNLDLSQNTALTLLHIEYPSVFGNMSTIDISQCINLENILSAYSGLTSLDVSQNTNLKYLSCWNNYITTLDLSQNPNLVSVQCHYNNLAELNLKNIDPSTCGMVASNNPNLTCIEVDDVAAATAAWIGIDSQTSFSESCGIIPVTSIAVQGQAGATTISTLGGTLQMEASVLPMNATDGTYTWGIINLTGSADIDANGLVTAITDGTIKVTVTANDGSGVNGSENITISNQSSSIGELKTIPNISIYPNPANAQLTIDVKAKIETISIMDIMGQTVKTIVEPDNTVNVSDLTKGIYFLQIQIENALVSRKIIKE